MLPARCYSGNSAHSRVPQLLAEALVGAVRHDALLVEHRQHAALELDEVEAELVVLERNLADVQLLVFVKLLLELEDVLCAQADGPRDVTSQRPQRDMISKRRTPRLPRGRRAKAAGDIASLRCRSQLLLEPTSQAVGQMGHSQYYRVR